jgi:hypothetical protein
MGTASIVHYGVDQSCRVPLLQHTGFEVADCESLPLLRQLLRSTVFDGILIAVPPTTELIRTSRRLSGAPLIYFASDSTAICDPRFDLVIEPFTRPDEWIASVHKLLEESLRIRAESDLLRTQSGCIREESLRLRTESAALRDSAKANIQRSKDCRNPKL